jgi:hypothetical protein
VEPPSFGWTDIILERTYEYRNRCHGTRFTLLIMQGQRYEYKLIKAYMFDTVEYKLCEYINLEDNSIKDIWELQRRRRAKSIPDVALARSSDRYDSFDWWRTRCWQSGLLIRHDLNSCNRYTAAPLVINQAQLDWPCKEG